MLFVIEISGVPHLRSGIELGTKVLIPQETPDQLDIARYFINLLFNPFRRFKNKAAPISSRHITSDSRIFNHSRV